MKGSYKMQSNFIRSRVHMIITFLTFVIALQSCIDIMYINVMEHYLIYYKGL